jgi:hypothetical protein
MFNLHIAESLTTTILLLCAYAVCATVTEVGQAWIAHRMGDDTAAEADWLNLNPLAHIDLIGVLFVIFLNFAWVRIIPVNPLTNYHDNKGRLALIYFSQALISIVMALFLFAVLLLWLGPTCIYFAVSMFGSESVPLKDILNAFPDKSSFSILVSLFIISLIIYSIFIATISLIANGFRFFYSMYWESNRDQEPYPDYIIWIIAFIVVMFLAEPVRRLLLKLIIYGSLIIGHLCGAL